MLYDQIVVAAHDAAGHVVVGGYFGGFDGVPAGNVARLGTTCPAAVAPAGAGCSGSAGPVVLTPRTLAWLDSPFRTETAGLPNPSFAVAIYAAAQMALPLPTVHPLGVAGCTLWVDDTILIEFHATTGRMHTQIAVPASPALVGVQFHHQVVPVEVDGSGAITALTASNALTLTIGAY